MTEVTGLVVRASVPGVRVGEIVTLEGSGLAAEVVGFRGDEAVLMPLGEAAGIGPDSLVTATGARSRSPSPTASSAACSTGSGAQSTAADRSPAPSPGRWIARRPIRCPAAA